MRNEYIFPAMLGNVQGNKGAPTAVKAKRDTSLTSTKQYIENDLVIVNSSGYTEKLIETTPASIANILLAGHTWDRKYATVDFEDDSVPSDADLINNLIQKGTRFIGTYQGTAADGADYTLVSADLNTFMRGTKLEMKYNATEKCMTIRNTSTNPTVQIVGIHKGIAGDLNPIVEFVFLDSVLA